MLVYLSYPAIYLEYRFWAEKSFGLVYIGDFRSLTLLKFCAIYGQNINRLIEVRNQLRFHFSKCNRQMILRSNQESSDDSCSVKSKVIGPESRWAQCSNKNKGRYTSGTTIQLKKHKWNGWQLVVSRWKWVIFQGNLTAHYAKSFGLQKRSYLSVQTW